MKEKMISDVLKKMYADGMITKVEYDEFVCDNIHRENISEIIDNVFIYKYKRFHVLTKLWHETEYKKIC